VCLSALTWACSVYDAAMLPSDPFVDEAGAPGNTSAGGSNGAAGQGIGSSGGGAGAGGLDVSSTATTGGGSAGAGVAGGASDGAAGAPGAGGAGGRASGSGGGGTAIMDAGDAKQDQNQIVDAKPDVAADVAPDNGCSNPTLCGLKAALVHRYQFNGMNTIATDSVGMPPGTVVNAQLSGTGTVVLAGGATDQYVDLPNGIVRQLTDATFELWVTWNGGAGWQRIFDFGDTGGAEGVRAQASTTFYLTPQATTVSSYTGPSVLLVGFKRANQLSDNETHALASQPMAVGSMVHVAVVVDDSKNQLNLYVNSALESSIPFADSLSLLNDVNNWLGRSQYSADVGFAGTIHEFRIYAAALSQTSVQASFVAGPDTTF
jgi:hypothetical protein